MTFVIGTQKKDVVQEVGLYDDLNGLFLRQTNAGKSLVIRSSTSGAPVDTVFPQEDWNKDRLDGTGPSGVTLDLTKFQIFPFDYQWLGGGRVRFVFSINGEYIITHEENYANVLPGVFMRTPSLPLRYALYNTAETVSPTTMDAICSSIATEGKSIIPGYEYSVTRGIVKKTVDNSRLVPVLAIRLKNEFPAGRPNRRIARYLQGVAISFGNQDAHIQIQHVHEPLDVWGPVVGIPAIWSDVQDSGLEFSDDIDSFIGSPVHPVIDTDALVGAGNRPVTVPLTSEFINLHSFLSQNFASDNSELIVISAQAHSGTADILASIQMIVAD